MRFMIFIQPNLPPSTEDNLIPSRDAIETMSRYNRQLREAGVLLEVNGLHSPNEAVRISFTGGKPQVVDGPFAETKEMVGGYWIIEVKSKAEAIEWAKRCPVDPEGAIIEVRQIFEISDFPPELQEAVWLG
ncbi:MAG TPA: YciI family protein [Candidatus Dormibacteraeota bacterium]|nr:YciI family protein [Candidatus Dormibacteraeota bacterium]